MMPPNMAQSGEKPIGVRPEKSSANRIPARSRYRPPRNTSIPPQPTVKHHTVRLVIATSIGTGLMLVLLLLAVQYAQRDWSQKNQRARTPAHKAGTTTAGPDSPEAALDGWAMELPPAATQRYLRRLAADRYFGNGWLILARSLSSQTPPDELIACLRMAMATSVESADMHNDLGAAYIQQKRMKDAIAQFRAADQIQPGFAPARFNLALCAISDRNPGQAIRLLGQYLGQRPDDITALRLQSTLLTQIGHPREALGMLEKFLKDQPPEQPLFLEAATLAARLGQNGTALRYLETAVNGNPIQTVVKTYQSPTFRDIRLSGEGDPFAGRLANRARAAFSTPVPESEILPLRATTPEAKVR